MKEYRNALRNKKDNPAQYVSKEIGYNKFMQVVEYYDDYINDKERLLNEIIFKIKKYEYVNCGIGKENEYEFNKHLSIINGESFEYRTGIGINCQDSRLKFFAREKIVFDCLLSVISDTNILDEYIYNEDDFLQEFGYCDNIKKVREGEEIIRTMKENRNKLIKIINTKTIEEIQDIIEL